MVGDNAQQPSVFISYATPTYRLASAVRDKLNKYGLKTWLAPDDVPIGAEYPEEIEKAIKSSDFLILLFSKAADESIFVRKEIERAIAQGVSVIPVWLNKFTPSSGFEFLLSNVQWIDATGCDSDEIANLILPLLDASAAPQQNAKNNRAPGGIRLTWSVWFFAFALTAVAIVVVNIISGDTPNSQLGRVFQQELYSLDVTIVGLLALALLVGAFVIDRNMRRRGRVVSVRTGDMAVSLGVAIAAALFFVGYAIVPLVLSLGLLVFYVFTRNTFKGRPRVTVLAIMLAVVIGAFWGESRLYAALRSDNTVILLLPNDRCPNIDDSDCRIKSGENYLALHGALKDIISRWNKVDFYPNNAKQAEKLRDRFLRNEKLGTPSSLARLTVDALWTQQQPFDRAVTLTMNSSASVCDRQSVQIDAILDNWRIGKPPRLAFGKLETPPRGGWSSDITVPSDKIDRAALFLSIDLVARLMATFEDLDENSPGFVSAAEMSVATQKLFETAEQVLRDARRDIGPEFAAELEQYDQLRRQAAQLQDPFVQLAALQKIADWVREISEIGDACERAVQTDRTVRSLSFDDGERR